MCGIAGIIHAESDNPVDQMRIERMIDCQAHRGPDDRGVWVDRNAGLGHCRLAILDPTSAGHQPMPNAAGTSWISYNGECYNYPELRRQLEANGVTFRSHTDTEALLHLYDQQGPDMLAALNGMFAFAIWDSSQQQLFLARDRLGIKPLYYRETTRGIAFASEMKALLTLPDVDISIDPAALWAYLHFGSVPGDRAFVADIRKLPPGHFLLWKNGASRLSRYWDLPEYRLPPIVHDEKAAAEALREHLGTAVQRRLLADVPVGGFLSGGVDSSGIAALAAPKCDKAFSTFGIAFEGQTGFDETPYAKRAATHCGVSHHAIRMEPDATTVLPDVVWHADEPFAVASAVGVYLLAKEARKHVKVVLSGDGADEIFAGYPWRHSPFRFDQATRWVLRRLLLDGFVPGWIRAPRPARPSWKKLLCPLQYAKSQVYMRDFACFEPWTLGHLVAPHLYPYLRQAAVYAPFHDHYLARLSQGELAAKLYTEIKTTLVSEMLSKVDRMTMAAGLEARVPFMDHELASWSFDLPAAWKVTANKGKCVLKHALAPLLPADLLHRPKHGFDVPLAHWMRDPRFRTFLWDHLSEDTIRRRGLFNIEAVTRLRNEHQSGTRDRSSQLYALLCLELWCRRFLDGNGGAMKAVELSI